jgi:xylan 1,4-beta-xylosidase
MFSRMHGQRLSASSTGQAKLDDILANGVRDAADVGVIATGDAEQVAVLVWHYHDDDLPGPDARIDLAIRGLPRNFTRLAHYRIDGDHSNAYAAWQRMGSPIAPDKAGYESLRTAGKLATMQEPSDIVLTRGQARLAFALPRQGVSLLVFSAGP